LCRGYIKVYFVSGSRQGCPVRPGRRGRLRDRPDHPAGRAVRRVADQGVGGVVGVQVLGHQCARLPVRGGAVQEVAGRVPGPHAARLRPRQAPGASDQYVHEQDRHRCPSAHALGRKRAGYVDFIKFRWFLHKYRSSRRERRNK